MKQFLKAIGRKNAPSLDEIAGDEHMFNTYMAIFAPDNPSEANRRRLAREAAFEAWRTEGRRRARERART